MIQSLRPHSEEIWATMAKFFKERVHIPYMWWVHTEEYLLKICYMQEIHWVLFCSQKYRWHAWPPMSAKLNNRCLFVPGKLILVFCTYYSHCNTSCLKMLFKINRSVTIPNFSCCGKWHIPYCFSFWGVATANNPPAFLPVLCISFCHTNYQHFISHHIQRWIDS